MSQPIQSRARSRTCFQPPRDRVPALPAATLAALETASSGQSRPLPPSIRPLLEDFFHVRLEKVLLHSDRSARQVARSIGARAFTMGRRIFLADPDDDQDLGLLAHEVAHVLQFYRSAGQCAWRLEPHDSRAEIEAARAADAMMRGAPGGPVRARLSAIACTRVSTAVERLVSYSWNDWMVTDAEERQVLRLLEGDPTPSATVHDLSRRGTIPRLFERIDGAERAELAQLIGGRIDGPTAAAIRQELVFPVRGRHLPDNSHVFLFDVSNDLQTRLRAMHLAHPAPAFDSASFAGLVGTSRQAPFGGAGATGISPSRQPTIPLSHQWSMAWGNRAIRALYHNPLGNLPAYLASLSASNRVRQAELLLRQPIASLVPYSYAGRNRSRAQIMEAAAAAHNLHAALVAAFILAEQRDQSAAEDAKDYQAAISLLQQNTSIGLGQVVISTARRNDLFADLLSSRVRQSLQHNQIALLLTSDEFNIFAAARYLRQTANTGAAIPIARLPRMAARFPGLDMSAYQRNSRTWPDANVAALGAEYTSTPWDDRVTAWGDFVLAAYHDVVASGVF